MSGKSRTKSAPPRSAPETDILDDYTPPRIVTTGPKPEDDRIPIFYVDDREYTAPRRVSAPAAVRALRIAATQSPEAAAWHMLQSSLDAEALEVLETCEYVTYEQAQEVCTRLGNLYYGQAARLSGK